MKIKRLFTGICVVALCGVAGVAQSDEFITNGDFEDTTDWGAPGTADAPVGWLPTGTPLISPALQQSGANAIGGSGTSALMIPGLRSLESEVTIGETASQWVLEYDFASVDPGGSGDRSLTGSAFNGINALITYRVNGDGDFQLFERGGAGWHTPAGLAGAVIFDDDVETTPLTHHLRITGHFDLSVPNYDVRITDSSSNIHESLGSTSWNKPNVGGVGVGPTTGDGITKMDLSTQISLGEYLVDNVSIIAEPRPGGDFDLDDDVDGKDFLLWQTGGSPNPLSASDLADWEANFGTIAPLSATSIAIPEPGASVLMVMGALCCLLRRKP